jgi:nucleoside-diphosphate-sugar epimerase/putative sterol carrier protein
MKVAVTGGAGQLGTLVLRRLVADRAVKSVLSVDLRAPSVAGAKLSFVQADIRETRLARNFEGCDAVIHCAFAVTRRLPRAEYEDINIGGSKNVFLAAVAAGAKTIVYASSIAAYGVLPGQPVPLVEDSPRRFQESFAYSACKYRVEEFLDAFEREEPDVSVARMRPSILIGARMEHALGDAWRRGLVVDVGGEPAPMVWDEDVADAFVLALKARARGAFNVSADDPVPDAEVARAGGMRHLRVPRALLAGVARASPLLARLGLGQPIDPAWVETTDARLVVSSRRAIEELGWKRRCPTATDVVRRYAAEVPRRLDRRLAAFFRVAALAARFAPPEAELMNGVARVHICLTGPDGGDFAFHTAAGRVRIEPGVPRLPTAAVTLRARTLLDLLAGRTDFSAAQFTGRIRVEGEGMSSMMIGAMVARFRTAAAASGIGGAAARRVAQWIAA